MCLTESLLGLGPGAPHPSLPQGPSQVFSLTPEAGDCWSSPSCIILQICTSLEGPGPGAAKAQASMCLFPCFSLFRGARTGGLWIPYLPSALAICLESELSLPILASMAHRFTDLWRARAEGLCQDPPTVPLWERRLRLAE